jgi:hypothetical protein
MQYAARELGWTLAHDPDFNRYADELGDVEIERVSWVHADLARRYWPRASPRQSAIARLLWLAAADPRHRLYRLLNAGGPRAYVVDAAPAGNRGYVVREDYTRTIERGSLLLATRGAGRCLDCGERLEQVRELTGGGPTTTYRRLDYCGSCEDDADAAKDLLAMSDTLRDAAAFILHRDAASPQRRAR